MSVRALTLLTIVTAVITLPAAASAHTSSAQQTEPIRLSEATQKVTKKQQKAISSERSIQASLNVVRDRIASLRLKTWECQDSLGVPRAKAGASIWALGPSLAYRKWAANQWDDRASTCQKKITQKLAERTIGSTGDWLTAVRIVQRIYPGTSEWLLYISHREGGWGRFIMNTQGSGAGGWMQFMSSTYYAYNDRAYADARSRGFIIEEKTNSWTHPLGQAITAGYMRYVGLDGCHWCLG